MASDDIAGRPSAEINAEQIIRPFKDFGRMGTIYVVDTLQRALDWSASANDTDGDEAKVAVGQAGTFLADGLVIKHGARLICPGRTATKFVPVAGAAQMFSLDTGPVQKVTLEGFTIDLEDEPTKHGIYFKAVPIFIDGANQGGLWHAVFRDLWIRNGEAEGLWLRGGGDAGTAPHQFIKLESVVVESKSTSRSCLRLSGQVGQLQGDAACRFDGISRTTAGQNILIERTVDDAEANNGDAMPYTIILPVTCQSRQRLVTVERGLDVSFDDAHFEEAEEGVHADISAGLVSVEGAYFGNVGHNAGVTGFAVRDDSGNVVVGKNFFAGTTDTHYVRRFGAQMTLRGGDIDSTGIRTAGITATVATTATIDTGAFETAFVAGGSATNIDTIQSALAVGKYLSLRANGGRVRFASGGNIDLGGAFDPFILPSGATITLVRNDLSGVWQLVGVSGPRGAYYGLPVFVNAAMSPYQILPDTDTVRVDASTGIVTVKMPSKNDTPIGKDVTVKKLDSSSNQVRVNGATTAENPDGQADNVSRLVDQTQAMTYRRNGTVGLGGWDTVSSVSARSGAPGVGALLTFGTHLTGTSYDGSAAVTLGTDATAANTVSTIVARDANGDFAARNLTLGAAASSGPLSTRAADGFFHHLIINAAGTPIFGLYTGTGADFRIWNQAQGAPQVTFNADLTTTFPSQVVARTFRAGPHNAASFGATNAAGFNTPFIGSYLSWQGSGSANDVVMAGYSQITLYSNNATASYATLNTDGTWTVEGNGKGWTVGERSGTNRLAFGGDIAGAFTFWNAANNWASLTVGSITYRNTGVGVVPGTTYYDSSLGGVTTIGKAGATWDWSVWNPTGSTAPIISNPTGTFNVLIQNDLVLNTASRGIVVSSVRRLSVSTAGVDINGTFTVSGTSNFISGVLVVSSTGFSTSKPVAVNTTTSVSGLDIADTAGNTGMSFTPAASGDSAFIDNRRVGGVTQFRSSSSTTSDRTWLSVSAAGNPTFGFGVVFSSTISVASTATMAGATFSAGVTFNSTVVFGSTVSFTTINTDLLPTPSGTKDLGGGANKWRDYYSNGKLEIGTTIQTGAPSGGTAAPWKLGQYITAAITVDTGHYVEIDIGGGLRKLVTGT